MNGSQCFQLGSSSQIIPTQQFYGSEVMKKISATSMSGIHQIFLAAHGPFI